MFGILSQRRVARSLVTLLFLGFIQVGVDFAQAAVMPAPTITSITAGNTTLTVNMATPNYSASYWAYIVTRRDASSNCVNSYGDATINYTGSLSSTISITGLTNGCTYQVRVAAYNAGIGNYTEADGTPTGYSNVLNYWWMNDSLTGASYNRQPFSSGCASGTTSQIVNATWDGTTTRPIAGCNLTQTTGYYYGYIKGPYTGAITFNVSADDASSVSIQGNTVAFEASTGTGTGTFNMVQGQVYRFEAWFHNDGGPGSMNLTWSYTGQSTAINIPSTYLANDPSVLAADGGCSIGLASRCAAGSALEIKQATGTNVDGQYWINVNGTPTLVYCIMNSAMGGGGWMLAMKGKQSSSTFGYTSAYWTDANTLNSAYPEKWKSGDAVKDVDAKYSTFIYSTANQVLALFPELNGYTGGAISPSTSATINSDQYGFSWLETFTSGTAWDGLSKNTAFSDGNNGSGSPTATPACVTSPNTLKYLFTNASRCLIRRVNNSQTDTTYSEPYSAVGNAFSSQSSVRFFGFNYGSSSTTNDDRARFGFGWNENGGNVEDSNDVSGGIGLRMNGHTGTTAGNINTCCATQNGMSANATERNLAFEMYIRNSSAAPLTGASTVRITAGRIGSSSIGQNYSQTVSSGAGASTYRVTPVRNGFGIDASTGTLKVSTGIAPGTYYETVTATDGNGASSAIPVTINVIADSSDTDTAISFNGSSNYMISSQTYSNTGDFSIEFWTKPNDSCSGSGNMTAIFWANFVFFCRAGDWYASGNTSASGWSETKLNSKVRSGEWVHIAVMRSSTTMRVYINNVNVSAYNSSNSTWNQTWTLSSLISTSGSIYIGGTGSAGQYYNGVIDEVKIFNSARTLSSMWSGAHSQESLSNANLVAYYDFNEGSGATTVINRAQSATSASDITVSGTWVNVATTTTSGPYTVVTFPRTIINSIGGWKTPDSITALTVDIVGGGGGGGGGYEGGGGGAGGFIETTTAVVPKSIYSIRVGVGGRGLFYPGSGTESMTPTNGDFSSAFSFTANGGGSGALELNYNSGTNFQLGPTSGGSGGGGSWANYFTGGSGTTGQGNAGGNSKRLENGYNGCTSNNYVGAGGGGAGSAGADASCNSGGNGGAGKTANVLGYAVAGGGGGSHRSSTSSSQMGGAGGTGGGGAASYADAALVDTTGGAQSGAIGTGGGGGANNASGGSTGSGGHGGSGIVALRYITALKPSYTPPSNAYLDVGQTETFTTNVAADSATAVLTRTFRWESSTTGSGGTFSLIKQGTGAANAAFSWVPTDTSTSGSNYVYRVIVTDSDTAGLFIVDTSTAVYATINKAMVITSTSGNNTINKTVSIKRTETFTITLGTPTYVATLTPTIAGITIDTSTAGRAVLIISDTQTVGTYLETLTVVDSVSAALQVALTIKVNTPPSFSASSEQIDSGTILYLDAANSQSYLGTGSTWYDISGKGTNANLTGTMTNLSGVSTVTCNSPTYSTDYRGVFNFNSSSSQCALVTGIGSQPLFTTEAWILPNGVQTDYAAIFATPWNVGVKINYSCYFFYDTGNSTEKIYCDIYTGSAWVGAISAPIQLNGSWIHLAFSYDGSYMKMYLNGTLAATSTSVSIAPGVSTNYDALFIGRRWDAGNYYNGSIASLRIYNRALSLTEIQQNYNATTARLSSTGQNDLVPSQKYGSSSSETFTATSGSGTKTISLSVGNRTGIVWDTSTAGTAIIKVGTGLIPGTYFDTVTAVDAQNSSVRIALRITINKADTLTVTVSTLNPETYTASPIIQRPTVSIATLAGLDTVTTSVKYTATYSASGGATCAQGGSCVIGDTGPGGGIVFYDAGSQQSWGRYLEAAPANWATTDNTAGNMVVWCSVSGTVMTNSTNVGTLPDGIGQGFANTYATSLNGCTAGAIYKARQYRGPNNKSDWYLPTAAELTLMANNTAPNTVRTKLGLVYDANLWGYWGSNVNASDGTIGSLVTVNSAWNIGATSKDEATHNMLRPIRAFSSGVLYDTTTVPTNAGTYTLTPQIDTFTVGNANYYVNIVYVTSTFIVNKAFQVPQSINLYGAVAGSPFAIIISGGSGTGTRTETVTAGVGCSYSNLVLTSSNGNVCSIRIVKLSDNNYLTDTYTADVYFMTFINSGPTNQSGSGSGIGINEVTALTIEAGNAPTVTGFTLNGAALVVISGSGFGTAGNTTTVVKFWRNKIVTLGLVGSTNYIVNDTTIYINGIPAGTTAGRITVVNAYGTAFSVDSYTP